MTSSARPSSGIGTESPSVARRQNDDLCPLRGEERIGGNHQSCNRSLGEVSKRRIDLRRSAADTTTSSRPTDRAAALIPSTWIWVSSRVGFTITPIGPREAVSSCSNSNRFGSSSMVSAAIPVMLPPGRFMLATRPLRTGSGNGPNTSGIVAVASLIENATAGPPARTMTEAGILTSSVASVGSRSA